MRLPFPDRVPLLPTMVFCLILCATQFLEGTTALFCAGTMCFIIFSVLAFNRAGGLTMPSGAWVFSYAIGAVIFGVTYKAFLGEAGQTNLVAPERTIEVYVGSMAALVAAVYANARLRRKKALLPVWKTDEDMNRASLSCLVLGAGMVLYLTFRQSETRAGSLFALIAQLNGLLPLAVLLSVSYTIRKSGGSRSINVVSVVAILFIFLDGVLNFSKEGMMVPFVCWLFPAAAQRYRVSLPQVASLVLAFAFTSYYLVPYSQYGRVFKIEDGSFSDKVKLSGLMLSNLGVVRTAYYSGENARDVGDVKRYYNKPQGLADRLEMITPDDLVIGATEAGAVFGIAPTLYQFENVIPHFIWPNKPNISYNNVYAHEVGMLGDEDDTTTGVSFSPAGEAYHQAKWIGILVMLPVFAFVMFFVSDSILGDTRHSPFALLGLIGYLHGAPESGLSQFIFGATTGLLQGLTFAFITIYLMPLFASFILGPSKANVDASPAVAPEGPMFGRAGAATSRWSKSIVSQTPAGSRLPADGFGDSR